MTIDYTANADSEPGDNHLKGASIEADHRKYQRPDNHG